MSFSQSAFNLEFTPQSRVDFIDINSRVRERFGDVLSKYRRALYYSYHTTGGYFEEGVCKQYDHNGAALRELITHFQTIFPPNANYRHDQLELRGELTEAQREVEPRNADSHLTFICAGLTNCVTYDNDPRKSVYFVDLDGVSDGRKRRRQTTVVGFNRETVVAKRAIPIRVSNHSIDSVNLKDPRYGFEEMLSGLIREYDVVNGRIDIALAMDEQSAGLTVNEYETLLMLHDLAHVLRNPFKFMARTGRHMLRDPRAIPGRMLEYAKYDLVQVVNELVDRLRLNGSLFERAINQFIALPASRFLRMKRSLSLLVRGQEGSRPGDIVQGTYQSPILVQWRKPDIPRRNLTISLVRFE